VEKNKTRIDLLPHIIILVVSVRFMIDALTSEPPKTLWLAAFGALLALQLTTLALEYIVFPYRERAWQRKLAASS
jgi:hypothetical protein